MVFPSDTLVPKVRPTILSVRVVVEAIWAIAPANDLGWGFGLLIWEGMSWVIAARSISSF